MLTSRPLRRLRPHKIRADRVHSPGIPADIAESLSLLAEDARRVTRHSPPESRESTSRYLLNATLAALAARRVPIEDLARATGINHQAIRRRIASANPNDGVFSIFPESLDPSLPLGGRFHYLLTPTGATPGRFTIREILNDPNSATGVEVLRTPNEALDWLTSDQISWLIPVRTSGEILEVVFAIDAGDLIRD